MEHTILDYLLVIGAGVIAGFLNAVAGGGSLITLPLLITMGLPSAVANATNRVAIVGQNIFAVAGYHSKGVHAFPYSIWLAISATLGAVLGAKIAVEIDDRLFNRMLSVIMIIIVAYLVLGKGKSNLEQVERMSFKHQALGVILFFGVGIYGGFIQAGIGFIIIAILTGVNGFGLVKSNSAKVFVALIYTSAALIVFIIEGVINWKFGLILAVGNAIGAWVGSRWSAAKGDVWVKRILVLAVTGLAIKLWFYGS